LILFFRNGGVAGRFASASGPGLVWQAARISDARDLGAFHRTGIQNFLFFSACAGAIAFHDFLPSPMEEYILMARRPPVLLPKNLSGKSLNYHLRAGVLQTLRLEIKM
jgi:hypothetical protein